MLAKANQARSKTATTATTTTKMAPMYVKVYETTLLCWKSSHLERGSKFGKDEPWVSPWCSIILKCVVGVWNVESRCSWISRLNKVPDCGTNKNNFILRFPIASEFCYTTANCRIFVVFCFQEIYMYCAYDCDDFVIQDASPMTFLQAMPEQYDILWIFLNYLKILDIYIAW